MASLGQQLPRELGKAPAELRLTHRACTLILRLIDNKYTQQIRTNYFTVVL